MSERRKEGKGGGRREMEAYGGERKGEEGEGWVMGG